MAKTMGEWVGSEIMPKRSVTSEEREQQARDEKGRFAGGLDQGARGEPVKRKQTMDSVITEMINSSSERKGSL
jgi:hypothetical protein